MTRTPLSDDAQLLLDTFTRLAATTGSVAFGAARDIAGFPNTVQGFTASLGALAELRERGLLKDAA
jgi:hypothetical protein